MTLWTIRFPCWRGRPADQDPFPLDLRFSVTLSANNSGLARQSWNPGNKFFNRPQTGQGILNSPIRMWVYKAFTTSLCVARLAQPVVYRHSRFPLRWMSTSLYLGHWLRPRYTIAEGHCWSACFRCYGNHPRLARLSPAWCGAEYVAPVQCYWSVTKATWARGRTRSPKQSDSWNIHDDHWSNTTLVTVRQERHSTWMSHSHPSPNPHPPCEETREWPHLTLNMGVGGRMEWYY